MVTCLSTYYMCAKFQRNLKWVVIFHVEHLWNDPFLKQGWVVLVGMYEILGEAKFLLFGVTVLNCNMEFNACSDESIRSY